MSDAPRPDASAHSSATSVIRRRRFLRISRATITLVSVITLLVMGLEWQIKHRADVGIAQRHVSALVPRTTTSLPTTSAVLTGNAGPTASALMTGSTPVTPTTTDSSTVTTYQAENILLLGSDTRSGSNAAVGSDPSTNGVANSDVVMIAHISADRQHVTVLSIPRDTMVPAPTTCHTWDSTTGVVSDQLYVPDPGQRFHFNAGYSVGGPQCTVTEVQNLTGLQINRYIGIDFVGFQAMVDALGGITVDICSPVVDTVLGTVVPTAGVQNINGTEALNLVRARDVVGDKLSDLARIRRQQIVLSAILRQVATAGTLLNPAKLDSFLQAFVKNTVTDNVTVDDLAALAGSLGNLTPGIVNFYTLPTFPSTITPDALEVDTGAAQKIFAALVADRPVEPTSTKPTAGPATGNPAKTSVAPATSIPRFSLAFPSTSSSSEPGSTSTVESVNAGAAQCAGPGNE